MLGIFFIEYRILIWLFSFHTLIEFHCILISIDFIVYPVYVPLSMFLCFSLAAFKIFSCFGFGFAQLVKMGLSGNFLCVLLGCIGPGFVACCLLVVSLPWLLLQKLCLLPRLSASRRQGLSWLPFPLVLGIMPGTWPTLGKPDYI